MNFPVLDRLPIPTRQEARRTISHFKDELTSSLTCVHEKSDLKSPSDQLGARLLAARHSGELTEKEFRDNLTVLFVAGQENPQIGLISTLYLLAQHPKVQERSWEEIRARNADEPTLECLQEMPYMTSIVYESLRLLPPISQLINRRAAEGAMLGGDIYIPKGTYLGYHCYSTHRDPDIWGSGAGKFSPERWGDTTEAIQRFYRSKRSKAEFLSFHGGVRSCLGEKFAVLQLKVTLFVLIRRFTWRLDPSWPDKMTPVGMPNGSTIPFIHSFIINQIEEVFTNTLHTFTHSRPAHSFQEHWNWFSSPEIKNSNDQLTVSVFNQNQIIDLLLLLLLRTSLVEVDLAWT